MEPVIYFKMSFLRVLLCLFAIGYGTAQAQPSEEKLKEEIKTFQQDQNDHYLGRKSSPLTRKERRAFKGHHFYPIDLSYVVQARFVKFEKEDTIELMSSAGNTKYYAPYAKLFFKIGDTPCELTAYQSFKLRESNEYKDYLLLPFRDATSGETSYGGGRYLDILIPDGAEITLNFNLAYNPYCAYTAGYNCTIPPKENTLPVAIKSGLMAPEQH